MIASRPVEQMCWRQVVKYLKLCRLVLSLFIFPTAPDHYKTSQGGETKATEERDNHPGGAQGKSGVYSVILQFFTVVSSQVGFRHILPGQSIQHEHNNWRCLCNLKSCFCLFALNKITESNIWRTDLEKNQIHRFSVCGVFVQTARTMVFDRLCWSYRAWNVFHCMRTIL